jgi:diguanylate cyclase
LRSGLATGPVFRSAETEQATVTRDPVRTLVFAERALNKIKALGLPADPESFALWYAYAALTRPELNEKIDAIVAGDKPVALAALDRLHDRFFSTRRPTEETARVGGLLLEQIELITDLIEAALDSSNSFRMQLATAGQELNRTFDRQTIKAVIGQLVTGVVAMEERACSIEEQLRSAQDAIGTLTHELDQARQESNTDPTTSLSNRRHFDLLLDRAIKVANENNSPLSLLFIDVDRFKHFNDTHGHQVGDDVLRLLGTTLTEVLNGSGIAARIGGEEFAAVLPGKDIRGAELVAERIRSSIMSREVIRRATGERLGRITVSIGVAQYQPIEGASALIGRADGHLLRAKRSGRNTVVSDTAA